MVKRQRTVPACPPGSGPVRTCVGCRARARAGELLRVAVVDGNLVLDLRRRIHGRGAWIHPDPDCLGMAERRRAFPRALRVPGPLDVTAVAEGLARVLSAQVGPGPTRTEQEHRRQVDPS
ncbi:YlxR family protein [Labedaea rhizosphaerae]|uniref:YlxR family protein n=1 Tax=Labedaea rhizosphaerae TaxID=598644 RepID=UPI001FB6AF58|nr:YlxR family protein [Labedaea rhizosphaerae]